MLSYWYWRVRGWLYWLIRRNRSSVPLVLSSSLTELEPWQSPFEEGSLVAVGRVESGMRRVVLLLEPEDVIGGWMTRVLWRNGSYTPNGDLVIDSEANFGPLTAAEAEAVRTQFPDTQLVVYTPANFPSTSLN